MPTPEMFGQPAVGSARPGPQTIQDATHAVHRWAVRQPDPEDALRDVLTALGIVPGVPNRRCSRCEKMRRDEDFRDFYTGQPRETCQRCRDRKPAYKDPP